MTIPLLLVIPPLIIHSIIPTYYHKYFNSNTIKQTNGNGMLLTFDDGPDIAYTEQLLDLLKKHEVKAVFFVVTKNVKKYPHLIKRIIEEGHEIGLHSLEHKNAWLYSYFYTKKAFKQSLEIIKLLNIPCHYYRPPWGHTNLFTSYLLKKHQLKLCLWDVMVDDWKNQPESTLADRIVQNCHNHSIICLHDASHDTLADQGAPLNTIRALDIYKSR